MKKLWTELILCLVSLFCAVGFAAYGGGSGVAMSVILEGTLQDDVLTLTPKGSTEIIVYSKSVS